ncbi:hypothetical protein SELMODRAFT_429440 [Selaginella moellendorffii]|uniref:Uncharacterized protein n=1 Tax=Selaginella moellendorffii TaxID=88036 RepID=D8T664_SELML|nr:hypothetical protein SELMODRAFT_429437 [Selaginella moellendorffii]EFJ07918.1 hypothetical protein SELMODRAFT_429440 [Selaginella moellendorffii]
MESGYTASYIVPVVVPLKNLKRRKILTVPSGVLASAYHKVRYISNLLMVGARTRKHLRRERLTREMLAALAAEKGKLFEVEELFYERIPVKDVFSWNTLRNAYTTNGRFEKAKAAY